MYLLYSKAIILWYTTLKFFIEKAKKFMEINMIIQK